MSNSPPINKPLDRLSHIRIVLIGTTHPGNIGAAARAMKTMGLTQLTLVQPKSFPSAEATARASGADDILFHASVCETLEEALADVSIAIATTARSRSLPWPVMTPKEMADSVIEKTPQNTIAIVFGREHSGMSNEELMHCHAAVTVDANPEYSSLNLAAAVQIMAYEIRQSALFADGCDQSDRSEVLPLANQADMERFYTHLQETMINVGYLDPENPRRMPERIRRLFNRAQLEPSEVQILRGLLTATQRMLDKPDT